MEAAPTRSTSQRRRNGDGNGRSVRRQRRDGREHRPQPVGWGLRRKGGRGRSAAHITGLDIVNLTFALILGAGMKDAPEKIGEVGRMHRNGPIVTACLSLG